MKILLFRFEKDMMHTILCDLSGGEISVSNKDKFVFITDDRGKRYQQMMGNFADLQKEHTPDAFAYQMPQKYRGAIKDEEGFVGTALLSLYCAQQGCTARELSPVTVRQEKKLSAKEFKEVVEKQKAEVAAQHKIAKSDKLIDGLAFISMIGAEK